MLTSIVQVFPVLSSLFLGLASVNYWFEISGRFLKNKKFWVSSKIFIIVSLSLLFLTLLSRWKNNFAFPLSNLYESLLFLCWSLSALLFFLELKTKSKIFGVIITPVIFFLSIFSANYLPPELQKAEPLVPALQSNWLMMHVSVIMLSYSILLIGSLFSILFLFVKKKLSSSKSFTLLLDFLDIWSYRIIGLGFPFLTLGIISGSIWANDAWGAYWSWDPKEAWALITWLIFAIYLHARLVKDWKAENAAYLGSIGFFSIWICYLGVNFFTKGLHSYGSLVNYLTN